jgi:hypothetical protein
MRQIGIVSLIFGSFSFYVASCKTVGKYPALTESKGASGPGLSEMMAANSFSGHATVYEDFSAEGGGCGPTEKMVEEDTSYQTGGVLAYAALNVANTPGDRSYDPILRATSGQKNEFLGAFQAGKNCGRWVEATIPWEGKSYKANFIVGDSCYDPNNWCRDFPGHIDLSIYQVAYTVTGKKMNQKVRGKGWPINWTNPDVTWRFIEAPNYKGPIRVYFVKRAQPYWPTIIVTNLKNGLGGVSVRSGDAWQNARMDSDRGQVYVLPAQASDTFTIRIRDHNNPNWNQETYRFKMPSSCRGKDKGGQYIGCPEILAAESMEVL